MISFVLAVALVIAAVTTGVAQGEPDGFFKGGRQRFVWKSAAAHDEWQRAAGTSEGERPKDSLIACEVDSGTSLVVRYAIPPRGYGVEIVDGPNKGCQGLALTETVEIHAMPEGPKTGATRTNVRETFPSKVGTSEPPVPPRDTNIPLRPLMPPLPSGSAVPIRPGLR